MAIGATVKGITIEFNGETTKLSQALRDIDTKAKGVDKSLNQVNRALKFNPGNTELLAQKQTLLAQKIEQTRQKLAALKTTQSQLDDDPAVDRTSQEYMELQREIIETESKLKHFQQEQQKLNNIKFEQLGSQFKTVGQGMVNVGRNMTQYVTTPIAAVGAIGAKSFAEVDKTMQLTNKTMGNTQAQADLLNKAMKDAAANSTYGMSDAATATLNFARAGLTAEQAASALAPSMNLAAGEGGNLDVVSAGLVATINGFGGSFSEASKYADVFANACNNSALDIDSLSQSMSIAAPVFKAAGYNVNDAALYMGVMANKGIDANVAANALKTGFARLVSPSKQAKDMMDKLGISVTNTDGSMKSSTQIQEELHNAFGKLSKSEQVAAASAIFGKNQMSNWLALIGTAPTDVQALSTSLQQEGTTAEMATAMMSGFGGSLEKLKSSLDVAVTSLGEALAPVILKVAKGIQSLVDWFNGLSPSMQQTIATVLLVIAAIGPLLIVIGKIAMGIGAVIQIVPTLINGFKMIGTAFGGLVKILMTNPWMAIAALAVAAIVLIVKNWDTIKEFFSKLWGKVKEIAETVWNAIKSFFVGIWNGIKGAAETIWNGIKGFFEGIWNGIKSTVETVWNGIKSFLKGLWEGIKTVASTVWNGIKTVVLGPITTAKDALSKAWNTIKEKASNVWNAIKGKASEIWGKVKDAVTKPITTLKEKLANIWSSIKEKASNVWQKVKDAVTKPIEAARDKVKRVIDKIKGFFDFDFKLPKIKLPHFSISPKGWSIGDLLDGEIPSLGIDWYAKGGIFKSPSVIGVGERGPEAVLPIEKLTGMFTQMADNIVNGMGTMLAMQGQGQGQEIVIPIYLYPNGPKMGEEIVRTYDRYKTILG